MPSDFDELTPQHITPPNNKDQTDDTFQNFYNLWE